MIIDSVLPYFVLILDNFLTKFWFYALDLSKKQCRDVPWRASALWRVSLVPALAARLYKGCRQRTINFWRCLLTKYLLQNHNGYFCDWLCHCPESQSPCAGTALQAMVRITHRGRLPSCFPLAPLQSPQWLQPSLKSSTTQHSAFWLVKKYLRIY